MEIYSRVRQEAKNSLIGSGKNVMGINTPNTAEYHESQLFADCCEEENKHLINIFAISGGPAY